MTNVVKIDWLQVNSSTDFSIDNVVNRNVEIIMGINKYIIDNLNENELDISWKDYYQAKSWFLVKKFINSEYVNNYRNEAYDMLKNNFWDTWLKSYFLNINKSVTLDYFNNFISNIDDTPILLNIYLLAIIELDITWKFNLRDHLVNIVLGHIQLIDKNKESVYDELIKLLAIYFFSNWELELSYNFIEYLSDETISKNKELYLCFITYYNIVLLNGEIENLEELEKSYKNIVNRRYIFLKSQNKKWSIDKESFLEEKKIVLEWYLDYYIKRPNNWYNLKKYWEQSLLLWNNSAYFHIIHAYLQAGDYENANKSFIEYNKTIEKDLLELEDSIYDLEFSEDNIDDLELFYILWSEQSIFWAVELLFDFYREQFRKNWFCERYFVNIIFYSQSYDYILNKDDIFFVEYNKEFNKLDNNDEICSKIYVLFSDYIETQHNIYLEKILHIISKNLHNGYNGDYNIKKSIILWLEKLSLDDDFIQWYDVIENKEFDATLSEQEKKLNNVDYFNARFDELVMKFITYILNEQIYSEKDTEIATYLASILQYYWFLDDSKKVLEYDNFFEGSSIIGNC